MSTPRSVGIKYATMEEQRKNEEAGLKQKHCSQLWMCLVMKVKANAVKNNTA